MSISDKRIKELERAEAKLNALEEGGVNNWEWYGESLKDYWAENERDEKMEDMMTDLLAELGSGAYEPSERGAGFTFTDDSVAEAMKVFYTYNIYFKEKGND